MEFHDLLHFHRTGFVTDIIGVRHFCLVRVDGQHTEGCTHVRRFASRCDTMDIHRHRTGFHIQIRHLRHVAVLVQQIHASVFVCDHQLFALPVIRNMRHGITVQTRRFVPIGDTQIGSVNTEQRSTCRSIYGLVGSGYLRRVRVAEMQLPLLHTSFL